MVNIPHNFKRYEESEKPERKAITAKLRIQNLCLPCFPNQKRRLLYVPLCQSLIVHIISYTPPREVKVHEDLNTNLRIMESSYVEGMKSEERRESPLRQRAVT